MEPAREDQLAHLQRLGKELTKREFRTEIITKGSRPYLRVVNPDASELTERVLCQQASDNTWCFWWPWHQPIGSVDDLSAVATKITTVLRSVEGQA